MSQSVTVVVDGTNRQKEVTIRPLSLPPLGPLTSCHDLRTEGKMNGTHRGENDGEIYRRSEQTSLRSFK